MSKTAACVLFVSLVIAAGMAVSATVPQDRTARPGDPTQATVWIQNRGEAEAVPVKVMASEAAPLRMQLVGTPMVTIAPVTGEVRAARQPWEYRSVTIPASQDPAAILTGAGTDGWEVTGVAIPTERGTVLVLKRPR